MTNKEYKSLLVSFGCVRCGMPAEIHHIRSMSGMGQNNDWLIVPLCPEHHRWGKDAVHNNTRNERDYLAETIRLVFNKIGGR